jgi:GABA permease
MSVHQCPRCELRFANNSEYVDHLRMEHGVDPRNLESIHYGWAKEQPPLYPDFVEQGAETTHRVLIIANATVRAQRLQEWLTEAHGDQPATFRLVVPATRRTMVAGEHSWFDTVGRAHPDEGELEGERLARHRMHEAVDRLATQGLDITGMVGHGDPVEAAQQALRDFDAEEIVLSTLPQAESAWLGADLPAELRKCFDIPVTVVEAG